MGHTLPRAAERRILEFDLSPITRRLRASGVPNAEALEVEFRRLALLWARSPGQDLAPSAPVDAFWHELVLDTVRYRAFCQAAFGIFVEHIPGEIGSRMTEQHQRTLHEYRLAFGTPPSMLWAAPGTSMPSKRG